ncbi:argininosuccinate lyase [Calditerrivibrio sp.]|jgi:argininosuccinate lyase|uniref:argininosuccinate lyase n=1 Tax=Calditerrivibrio sp. TaxID=2792612 RepID=UPI003D143D4C
MAKEKPWGGRFELSTDKLAEEFNASIHFDKNLYSYDIEGSIVHAKMLAKQGIIEQRECELIIKGLKQVKDEIDKGEFVFKTEDEDIHMAVEKRLSKIIGPVAGKLHTARSRNDQVATDFRLYVRDQIDNIKKAILDLLGVIIAKAEDNIDLIMPGYTHLQTAQPILFSHWIMAYFHMLYRDYTRFDDCGKRLNYSPLGSGALAGTTFPIDRDFTARELGFTAPTENSIDSVSDRDFALEFMSAASICQMHLSRWAEELIIFSSSEFKFIEFSDDFCTGSSIMPQKKNPDMAELIRGKTGRVYGNLISLLTTMKGLPLAYNKDMQEDKEPVFDTVNTLLTSLRIFAPMISKVTLNKEKMYRSAQLGYSTATDYADYLVTKGVPFRDAHHIVGETVVYAIKAGKDLSELTVDEFRQFTDKVDESIYSIVNVESCIEKRKSYGGTAKSAVVEQIQNAKKVLNSISKA